MIHKTKRIKKRKPKPIQFVEVVFKLSKQQRRSLNYFCKDHNTTINKLIKTNLKKYTSYKPMKNPPVHPRQLNLWGEEINSSNSNL